MSKNRIGLANRSELSLSRWIVVYVRVVLFTELVERCVNGGVVRIENRVEDTL